MTMASSEETEEALVERACNGDQGALGTLLLRHTGSLRARVAGKLSPALLRKISLADVVQDACVVASQRIAEFEYRGDGSFSRWLGKIADNRALKIVEQYAGTVKRQVAREVSRNDRPDTKHFMGDEPSPSQMAIAGELKAAAAWALKELPDDYREVLRRVQDEDRSFAEVAQRMGRSSDAVRMLYGRALDRFAELLERGRGGER